jgi:DNA-binding transcriptional LysR family regulator
MNLNQLRNFLTLARLQNVTKAAQALYISQPSLTNEIKNLEKELGYPLLDRVGRGVVLTSYGRQFEHVVAASLNTLDTGLHQITQNYENDMGTLKIACIPTAVGTYLPNQLAAFKQIESTAGTFHVYSKDTRTVLAGVRNGAYDIGISSQDPEFSDLTYLPLYDEPFVVIVPKDHPLAKRQTLTLDDLRDWHIHTYTPTLPIGQQLIEALTPAVFDQLDVSAVATDEITIAGAVAVNREPGIVADTMYLQSFDLAKIPLTVPHPHTRQVMAAYEQTSLKLPKIQQLLTYFTRDQVDQ